MGRPSDFVPLNCRACVDGAALGFDVSMAFQPIFDTDAQRVYSHEALVRGVHNEPASEVFAQVGDHNLYRFDQTCRVKAIKMAAELGISTRLNVNFLPNAVYRPELCIRTTLEAAQTYNFPIDRIVFEVTEGEQITDLAHLRAILTDYRQRGFIVAIDDFGAGYAGLNLLADFQPDLVKLDMGLIRDIDRDKARRIICNGLVEVSRELGVEVIAEGVERRDELRCLEDIGVHLFQGFYIAKPSFESLADINPALYADY
ncbi:diguanylate phosphodiesterase [Mycolicibacterium sphagni]|uniref:Diguanylate phosphodiesterase n=1 Tax=Mycolicibacterium sphagni TaxID=1786 RepID=A0A255DJF5_9MYCO|nr:diguanylate phosphodiesterase [Mycolicibacterium sphagni]